MMTGLEHAHIGFCFSTKPFPCSLILSTTTSVKEMGGGGCKSTAADELPGSSIHAAETAPHTNPLSHHVQACSGWVIMNQRERHPPTFHPTPSVFSHVSYSFSDSLSGGLTGSLDMCKNPVLHLTHSFSQTLMAPRETSLFIAVEGPFNYNTSAPPYLLPLSMNY